MRVKYIDGLRAVAVLGVVVSHAALYSNLDPHGPAAFYLRSMAHGVDLFFVLSGFCLSFPTLSKLAAKGEASFDLARFAAHRLLRILPPYWLAMLVTLLAFMLLGWRPDWSRVAQQAFFLDGRGTYVNQVYWSLCVEARWYFAFPALLWVWTRSPRAFAAIAILVVLAWQTRMVSIDLLMLPAFMLGVVAAHIVANRLSIGRYAFPLLVAIIPVALFTMPDYGGVGNRFSAFWVLGAFALVVACGHNDFLRKALSLRPLTWVGIASYSIYLVHDPLMQYVQRHGVSPLLSACLGIVVGFVFWAACERPFVSTRLRDVLIAEVTRTMRRWFSAIALSDMHLKNSRASTEPRRLDAGRVIVESECQVV